MRARIKIFIAALIALALSLAVATGAEAASSPSTPVHLSSAQVARVLFAAGDVGRLSQIPSGTESVVLEKVLQQLYTDNPALAVSDAVADIQGLQDALNSGSQAISPATLTVMAGNERILAILRVLTGSNPSGAVAHALAQVTNQALTVSEQSTQFLGQAFDSSADSLDTLSFSAFSPSATLVATASLAGTNNLFGQARDMIWKQASNESVFDSTHTLLSENPALQSSAINSFVGMLNSDGSLDTTVGELETLVDGGVQQIVDQNCTLASGTSGTSPGDCASGALHDNLVVAQNCTGPSDASSGCQAARNQAQGDEPGEVSTINSQQAATAAEAGALGDADATLGSADAAEAQAAAQLADQENAYLNYQSYQQTEKTVFDVATLAVSLGAAEIDPVAAVGGLLNVVGDAVGFGFGGPDPNTLILMGIQNIAQQLSDFEQYTQSAFQVVDTQLGNLSTQVSQIAAQIIEAQQQLTQLANQVATLQSSVDHLESEVQSLFAQGARNDLGTLINQYIGFQQANGAPLPQTQFAQAAGAIYQDATSTALTQTLLTVPTGFDALDADSLVTGTDPLTLDTNINLFNFFGAGVSDAPPSVGWPGALTTTCPPNANPSQDLCLPDPDFWATSARAFSQLLLENPSYVTPTRIAQLQAIQQEGQLIANALQQLSVNNAGPDAGGTGNKTLDAAINYFRHWGDADTPGGTPPSLVQAIKTEEQDYLGGLAVNTAPQLDVGTGAGVNPWGGPEQLPDVNSLQKLNSLQNIPLCEPDAGFYGVSATSEELPSLPKQLILGIDPQFENAARLGIGTISACWIAVAANVNGNNFDLTTQIKYFYTGQNQPTQQIATANSTLTQVNDCAGTPNAQNPFTPDVLATVVEGWETGANNCPDVSTTFNLVNAQETSFNSTVLNAVAGELLSLRRQVYNQLIENGAGLTVGSTQASNVQEAATRLDGANELLDGYVSLGLPQALASDDTLQGLISGTNADTFAPTSGGLAGTVPGSNVPAQLVDFYDAAINDDNATVLPVEDPADLAASLIEQRAGQLTTAINAHIVPTGSQAAALEGHVRLSANVTAPQTTSAVFAEENPYIGPTLDRLDETTLVLNDEMSSTPSSAPAQAAAPATPPAPTPAKPAAAKCTLKVTSNKVLLVAPKGKPKKGAPAVKPGTLTVTVRCGQAGKVKLTGTLTQLIGQKPKHGKQKSKSYKLGPVTGSAKAGRALTLSVKLPAPAVAALGKGANESAMFTVTDTNTNGAGRATAKVATLKGAK
jgi:phage shock protein A